MSSRSAGHRDPAFHLLVACVTWPPSFSRQQAITKAAAHPALDWQLLPTLAVRHRTAGLVVQGLTSAGVHPPPNVRAALEQQAQKDALRNLGLLGDAVALVRRFSANGIPVRILKGPALLLHLYGDPLVRQCNDLDLLIDKGQWERAQALCFAEGYARLHPPPDWPEQLIPLYLRWTKDLVFHHPNGRLLELHVRPTLDDRTAGDLDLPAGFGMVTLPGGMELPTILGDALYAYLCWHGTRSGWFRLKWLADLAALTAPCNGEQLSAYHAAAVTRGVGRASGLALLLLQELFAREIPAALLRQLRRDWLLPSLKRHAIRRLTHPSAELRSVRQILESEVYVLATASGFSVRVHEMIYLLIHWPFIARWRWLHGMLARWPQMAGGALLVLSAPLFLVKKIQRRLSRMLMARTRPSPAPRAVPPCSAQSPAAPPP